MTRDHSLPRIAFLILAVALVTALIISRLFYLQVLAHAKYAEIARTEQYGYTTLPARRGEILIEDYHSGESYKLGTNTTLNMIYADPTLIEDPSLVAETLAPFLFDLEVAKELDEQRHKEALKAIETLGNEDLKAEAISKLKFLTDEELAARYKEELKDILSKKTRDVIQINTDALDVETQKKIRALNLTGFEISKSGNLYAYPGKINDKVDAAKQLADVFQTDAKDLASVLLGKNRFVVLRHKLDPEASDKIEKILEKDRKDPAGEEEAPLHFLGIRMKEEYFRFYPEQELASQVLGYVNSAGGGQYGVEGSFDELLKGADGIFTSQLDAYGNQITVGESVIEEAVDGADITLTIDRAIQLQVERSLEKGVKDYRAANGQAIVIDPETGNILAMAQYPTYNPNVYGEVFEKEEITFTEDEKKRIFNTGTDKEPRWYFYKQVNPDIRIEIFPDPENPDRYTKYVNDYGPEVYKGKSYQEAFEPGSVFKPLVMSMAVDAGEVTPNSTFVDSGPIPVDFNVRTGKYDHEINTFDNQYFGVMTMTQVLQHSSNTGMTFIVRKLGGSLFYNYLKTFGFMERTGIGFEDEVKGKVSHYKTWGAESEMITKSFGQGLSMTPLQLVQAYTALVNDGVMMRPKIVKKIEYPDGRVANFEPEIVNRVLTKETAEQMVSMMTATAEIGYRYLHIDNHYFGGKSGTAQSYKHGKALSGPGTTIGSFVGFGPIDDPKFLVLVKLDYAQASEWGSNTAGPTAKEILEFLFDYYNLPPDKKD